MKLVKRDPTKGYLDSLLWVPKTKINVVGTKAALSPPITQDGQLTYIPLWKETRDHLLVPREFWEVSKLEFPVIDCRPTSYPQVEIQSLITLDAKDLTQTIQRDALTALTEARGGILQLACGKGKTVISLEYAARRGMPTLIIVDNTQLLKQWQEEIALHLRVPGGVGLIEASVFDWHKSVVMATYTTMANRAAILPEEVRRWFGTVIWDEAHHIGAPVFCRSAELFYGARIGLTATAERDDGMHIVYQLHLGKVLYKNLKQDLTPRVYFKWTGLKIDPTDPLTKVMAYDKNNELHYGKLAGFFGRWRIRLDMIIKEVNDATAEGRRVLILSNSIDECVNLLAIWNGAQALYTDIPIPTSQDVGETLDPLELNKRQFNTVVKGLHRISTKLLDHNLHPSKRQALLREQADLDMRMAQHSIHGKIMKELHKRQKEYLRWLLAQPSDAGLLIMKVSPDARNAMVREKQVIFSIMKYGREALDIPLLDTVVVCEPISSRNGLQQIMGRALRKKEGKKSPVIVFLEDEIGPMIGMCKKLRSHLLNWPIEEGGPYNYELLGHPITNKKRKLATTWTSPTPTAP